MAAYAPLVKVDGKYVLLDAADTLDLTTGQKAAIISDLDDLNDVVITAPADGDVLSYDSGSGDWVNAAGGGGGGLTQPQIMARSLGC